MRTDSNGIYIVLANLTDEAVTDYQLDLSDAKLAELIVSAETLFGDGQAQVPGGSGETYNPYKPFVNLNPYAMYIIELNP